MAAILFGFLMAVSLEHFIKKKILKRPRLAMVRFLNGKKSVFEWLEPFENGTKKGSDFKWVRISNVRYSSPHCTCFVLQPAQRQWWELKSEHYDTVLFFKMGKFYELFHMDAVLSVEKCGLVNITTC